MSNASLSFLPWVRQGAASAITVDDTLSAKQSAVATIKPTLTLNDAPVPGIAVRLRGPADVTGIDENQVVRTEPRPATTDFEPNCFASIEFDRPDFPWLFTPARANADARLRPWLSLVVVRKQPGVTLGAASVAGATATSNLPVLQIALPAVPAAELPDLKDGWAWAHAQVAADDTATETVRTVLAGSPALSLSRLVCPRVLAADAAYLACVVPSFELGRRAGLGLPVSEADLVSATAMAPAWSLTPAAPAQVTLPVYHHWEFRTGRGGDFESLARLLKPGTPGTLGRRTIDISHPGFPVAAGSTQVMEGALLPVTPASAPHPGPQGDGPDLAVRTALAGIVNQPSLAEVLAPGSDPLLAPPLYGRWHAGRKTVSTDAISWIDQLNLDPRWRIAAACGTRVVQQYQEELMASAWEQAAQVQAVNQRLRQMAMSLAVGERLHARHFAPLDEEAILRVTAPAFPRLRQADGHSLLVTQAASRLPVAATRSAMRRIGRLRGPLTQRLRAKNFQRSSMPTWVTALNGVGTRPSGVAALAASVAASVDPGAPTPAPMDFAVLPPLPVAQLPADSFFGAFLVAPEKAAVAMPGPPVPKHATELPGYFRAAALEHISRIDYARPTAPPAPPALEPVKSQVIEQTRPGPALRALALALVATGDGVLAPTAPGVPATGLEPVMAAPHFPQPMVEALHELGDQLLLPGLDQVGANSVLGLRTNRRFIEAYLVGLNHEMGRELLWRGFPTDQRGTCFDHFWGRGVPNAAPADIEPVHTWGERTLGDPAAAPKGDEFVMLMRSDLLQRYPNAAISMVPAKRPGTPGAPGPDLDGSPEQPPIFSGSLPPDVSFFGFDVTVEKAIGKDGGPGWYVVIREHPTEPRFGLDVGVSLGTATHLAIGPKAPAGVPLNGHAWGSNAAEMAAIVRRLPVRIALPASRLIAAT
jgi:hypothetical protein